MPAKKHPQIVTANDLFEGDVIYLTTDGDWSRDHGDAHVIDVGEDGDGWLARANEHQDRIVGAYLADVTIDEGGKPRPAHFREAFRTRGPSNYFHGKQAEA